MASKSKKDLILEARLDDKTVNSLKSLNNRLENLTQPLRKLRTHATQTQNIFRGVSRNLTTYGDKMASLGEKGTMAFSLPAAIGAGLALNVASQFEAEFNKVEFLIKDKGIKVTKDLEDLAGQINRTTQFSGKDALMGAKYIVMSGMNKMKDIQNVLPSVVNLTGAAQVNSDIGMAQVSDIMTNIMTQFSFDTNLSETIADKLTLAFTQSNQNLAELWESMKVAAPLMAEANPNKDKSAIFDETLAYLMKMADVGIKESVSGTALAGYITRMMTLTPEAMKILTEKYGLKDKDFATFLSKDGKVKDSTAFLELMDKNKVPDR